MEGPQPRDLGKSPYSPQYETIVAQGHTRPTPTFGAPALVWHVSVWPKREIDSDAGKEACDPHDTAGCTHVQARELFEIRRHAWINEINARLAKIEDKGRWRRSPDAPGRPKRFLPNDAPLSPVRFGDPPGQVDSASVGMTLWWKDANEAEDVREDVAIRVRLHAELTADYVTYSFYLDVGQSWKPAAQILGKRRSDVLAAVGRVRDICADQLVPRAANQKAAVDEPPYPEQLADGDGEILLQARNLLYVTIWEDFSRDMACTLSELAGQRGEVFANFRGLVMAAGGLGNAPTAAGSQVARPQVDGRPFPRFTADSKFDADGPEPNAVIRAYWPFVLRITPQADYRECVACGLMLWRALYITALGASSQWDAGEERPLDPGDLTERDIGVREEELSGREAATREDDSNVWRRLQREGNNHPVRYLILTKGEPNPRQIGRIVERINAMGTMRLFALKDWEAIKSADPAIRILGQELDLIMKEWSDKRTLAEELTSLRAFEQARYLPEYQSIRDDLDKLYIPGIINRVLRNVRAVILWVMTPRELKNLVKSEQDNLVHDAKYALLHQISSGIEARLINVGAELDQVGRGTIGGLHYRINRSAYYVREFSMLIGTLNVGNVPTWISYEQFVTRGLTPAFDYIASIGNRLNSLRNRLNSVTETIETSALVGQSAATRHNTAVLRQATTILIAVLAIYLTRLVFPGIWSQLGTWVHEHTAGWDQFAAQQLKQILDQVGLGGVVAILVGLLAVWGVYRRVRMWLGRKVANGVR